MKTLHSPVSMKMSMPRPSRKNHVLEAAAKRFANDGFDRATVRDIAQDAGMRAASVYRHFASKHEIFEAVLHWLCDTVLDVRESFLAADVDPKQKLKAFVRSVLVEHETNTIYRKILHRALIDDRRDVLETLVHRIHADRHHRLVEIIRCLDPQRDPYFALYTLLALSVGFVNISPLQNIIKILTSEERDPDYLANVILNLCFANVNWAEVSSPPKPG